MKKTKTLIAMPQTQMSPEVKKSYELLANNPDKFKELVRKSMPEFVAEMSNKEDMGNAMFEAGQEFLLVVLDTLRRYHNFDEGDLKEFRTHLTDVLTGVKEFETAGLNMTGIYTTGVLGDKIEKVGIAGLLAEIAEARYHKEKLGKIGMEMPLLPEAEPMLKELRKRNKK